MSRSRAEHLAYMRGYNGNRNRISVVHGRLIEIAKAYRALSRRPEDQRQCVGCARWTRGDQPDASPSWTWGRCSADFQWGCEARMWVDDRTNPKIITSEDFGCVNWIPRGDKA